MLILITNDDGINAPGLQALADVFGELGEVVVVAPALEQSGKGHAITMHDPLRPRLLKEGWWSVDGTPSDCVYVGIHSVLKRKPDLLVSGINRGPNLGDDLTYSGTVGAAIEGTIQGVLSLAVSLVSYKPEGYTLAARAALHVARKMQDYDFPPRMFLNLNVPVQLKDGKMQLKITRQGKRNYNQSVIERTDPRGHTYVWIGGDAMGMEVTNGGDIDAVNEGYVSLTPVQIDLTCDELIDPLKAWENEID